MKTFEKGSPEAFAWSRRMKKARKVRRAGKIAERAFFGKGGPLEVKENHYDKNLEHTYWVVTNLKTNKVRVVPYRESIKYYGKQGYYVELFRGQIKDNPITVVGLANPYNEVDYMKSHGWDLIAGTRKQPKVYSRTVGSDFQTIQKEARYYRLLNKGFLNTELQSVGEFPLLTDAIIRADKVGTRKELFTKKVQDNPPRSVNANIEGIVYNRCIEIRAEKTGYKRGFYKHPFSRGSKVCIYALDNGDLLIHSKAGVKLWQPD